MKKMKTALKRFLKDESGQGAIEYVFLVAVLVVILIFFRDNIKQAAQGKISELSTAISGFSADQ